MFVSVSDVRAKVQTDLDDSALGDIIANEEAALSARLGAPPDGTTAITEVLINTEGGSLYTKRPVATVTSVTESSTLTSTPATLAATDYYLMGTRGQFIRLAGCVSWGQLVTVVYVPADSAALWKQVIIELVRIALEQTTMRQESVAGEYTYQAPDWNVARERQYRRLEFPAF